MSSVDEIDDPEIPKTLKEKNADRPVIVLKINSIFSKFEPFLAMIFPVMN